MLLKIMLWPFVVALLGIVLVAVFSRKGGTVSEIAKKIQPSENSPLPWLTMTVVALIGTSAWILVENRGDLAMLLVALVPLIFAIFILFGIFVAQALQIFRAAIPLAAEIGENLSDKERQVVLRRTLKYFAKFKEW